MTKTDELAPCKTKTLPRVIDNDRDEISVTFHGEKIRGWSYTDESERRTKMLAAREFIEGWYYSADTADLGAICYELGCTTRPGVALRFVKELRRDLSRAHERHVELLRSWDAASLTERQELDRLRRGWGPSTPTERMARRTDLQAAMRTIQRAMDAVLPDDKDEDDLTLDHFQTAYDELSKGYRDIIALLHAIPDLAAPDLNPSSLAKAEGRQA